MLTGTFTTDHRFTFLTTLGSRSFGAHICGTFIAGLCSNGTLIEVHGARRAWSQSSGGVGTRWTFLTTQALGGGGRLEGESVLGTSLTILEATGWWITGERVAWTFQTWHQTSWRICTITAHWNTVIQGFGTLFLGISSGWATHAGTLAITILIIATWAIGTNILSRGHICTGRTVQATWHITGIHVQHFTYTTGESARDVAVQGT